MDLPEPPACAAEDAARVSAAKDALRRDLRAARATRGVSAADAAALRAHVLGAAWAVAGATVAAYVPVGTEPGDVALLDALRRAGVRVLLPVVTGRVRDRTVLDWAGYDGRLGPGPMGLLEPVGPRRGPAGLTAADVVLVPALAVDVHGIRLGQGGGFYDRSLGLARAGVPLIAVLHDGEVVASLPSEDHDVRVSAVLTPGDGIRCVG